MMGNVFVFYILYLAMWAYSAVALAVFFTYVILNRNNNFGDSSPNIDEYSARGIDYKRMVDDVTHHEKNHLFADYGNNPYENNKHRIPEQLLKNSKK